MLKYKLILLGIISFLLVIFSCKKEDKIPEETYAPTPFELVIPDHMPILEIPKDNPMTVEGVQLGRMLFYDQLLHKDEEKACADCHIQSKSFTDGPEVLPHMNFGWYKNFLWNGKISGTLEDVMLFEVAHFFETDLSRLNEDDNYPDLFFKAFGTKEITHELAAKALAQFERILVTADSKYDRVRFKNIGDFSDEEIIGYQLFFSEEGDCFHCHGGVLLTDNFFHNNGLDETFEDMGLADITGNDFDRGRFKTPTLRNIELTAPYMHDGRYETLEEVIDFYSEGIKISETIDPAMEFAYQGGVHLTDVEKRALVAFLKTFTDTTFINNPDFSSPF